MVWSTCMTKFWGLAALLVAACGSNTQETPDAAISVDAAPDAPPAWSEAPHGTVPEVVSIGGPVLATPKIVPIFFTGAGTRQAQIQNFLTMWRRPPDWAPTPG